MLCWSSFDWKGGLEMRTCRICGCTDDYACPGGCYWVGWSLCSKCASGLYGELERVLGLRRFFSSIISLVSLSIIAFAFVRFLLPGEFSSSITLFGWFCIVLFAVWCVCVGFWVRYALLVGKLRRIICREEQIGS